MGMQGTTTINFGSGSSDTTVLVAESTIQAGDLVEAWVFPNSTSSNTTTNHLVENLRVVAHSVTAGVGFSITVLCTKGLAHGQYSIGYVFN